MCKLKYLFRAAENNWKFTSSASNAHDGLEADLAYEIALKVGAKASNLVLIELVMVARVVFDLTTRIF